MRSGSSSAAVAVDVDALDGAVEAAIGAGDAGPLRVLGYGELTLVLGWPTDDPQLAVKRLPVFDDRSTLERYDALVREYIGALESRGVGVVPTELRWTSGPDALRAYLVQPLVPRAALLDRVLQSADTERGARLLAQLAGHVASVVDARVGFDAQPSNWAVTADDTLACFDLSTPLVRDEAGRDRLDVALFLSIYPWAMRGALMHVAHLVMAQYFDTRAVLVDVAANLLRERLERWLPAFLIAANAHVDPPIGEAEVRRYLVRDRRLWLTMQRLRRADRAWQRRVRRRPYPFLLAPPYAYGPPELPEEHP